MVKKFFITIMVLAMFVFVWSQFRHFYIVNNISFTVWKRVGGYCYVIPGRYYSLKKPKKDYIRVSNVGSLLICLKNDSSLVLFNNRYIDNDSVYINFKNYKFEYYSPNSRSIDEIKKWDEMRSVNRRNLPFLEVDIREMSAVIDDKEQ
ncbi:hypothetical protein SDC9_155184 [bioreactor metagenome]|jgi:hypothetical protein|uniref:Uncharacterized protein n=1 Tax=bioreactor metagenome TaxID=1076179 RepID=A0A645F312_9ZZZZ|nr:hypothetical protein [Bacteroides graminisolvens]MBP8763541.1 hypothetical protein [Acetoanaerobium sp.]